MVSVSARWLCSAPFRGLRRFRAYLTNPCPSPIIRDATTIMDRPAALGQKGGRQPNLRPLRHTISRAGMGAGIGADPRPDRGSHRQGAGGASAEPCEVASCRGGSSPTVPMWHPPSWGPTRINPWSMVGGESRTLHPGRGWPTVPVAVASGDVHQFGRPPSRIVRQTSAP